MFRHPDTALEIMLKPRDPAAAGLAHQIARFQVAQRLSRLLDRGLGRVTGYALPLKWDERETHATWRSGLWKFRQDRMYLLPGDSPMGYRLPLDSLPWVRPEEREAWQAAADADQRKLSDWIRIVVNASLKTDKKGKR